MFLQIAILIFHQCGLPIYEQQNSRRYLRNMSNKIFEQWQQNTNTRHRELPLHGVVNSSGNNSSDIFDIIKIGLPNSHQHKNPLTSHPRHLAQTSTHFAIVASAFSIEKDSGIIIEQRYALLRRKGGIDEGRVVVCEICKHKMLCVIFAVGRHDTAVEFEQDVLIFSRSLATDVQGFS